MALVASVDYPNKRIYLSATTVNTDLDVLDIYKEVRNLRATTTSHRGFKPIIVGGGNITKIPGLTYTAPYVQLLYGCRIVPYNSKHKLRVIRDTFTDDGYSGINCFDRTTLTHEVDIDIDVDKVEVREVATGGSSLSAQDIWQYANRTLTTLDTASIVAALQANFDAIPSSLETAIAIRNELAVELARIDATISSRYNGIDIIPANVKQMNDANVLGNGTSGNKWRG